MSYRQIAEILEKSSYVVCLSGREMIVEDGISSMRNMETAYAIELQYDYSPEELFSAQFFSTRAETFYEFYRSEVLNQAKEEPGVSFHALAELERMGILKATISRQLFDFPKLAGCQNVYDLHGNIYEKNRCPRCGREYPMEYLRDAKKVPLCEKCRVPIHPGVTLLGEMIDIGRMTKAAEEVSKADTLLLAGAYMKSEMAQQFLKYYKGHNVILIHSGTAHGDKDADFFISEQAKVALPAIIEELKAIRAEDKPEEVEYH